VPSPPRSARETSTLGQPPWQVAEGPSCPRFRVVGLSRARAGSVGIRGPRPRRTSTVTLAGPCACSPYGLAFEDAFSLSLPGLHRAPLMGFSKTPLHRQKPTLSTPASPPWSPTSAPLRPAAATRSGLVPPSRSLTALTVFSIVDSAGLLHPAADPGVHRVTAPSPRARGPGSVTSHDAQPYEAFPSPAAAFLKAPPFLPFAIQGWFDFKVLFRWPSPLSPRRVATPESPMLPWVFSCSKRHGPAKARVLRGLATSGIRYPRGQALVRRRGHRRCRRRPWRLPSSSGSEDPRRLRELAATARRGVGGLEVTAALSPDSSSLAGGVASSGGPPPRGCELPRGGFLPHEL